MGRDTEICLLGGGGQKPLNLPQEGRDKRRTFLLMSLLPLVQGRESAVFPLAGRKEMSLLPLVQEERKMLSFSTGTEERKLYPSSGPGGEKTLSFLWSRRREKSLSFPWDRGEKTLSFLWSRRREKCCLSPPGRKEGEMHPPPTTRGGQSERRMRFICPPTHRGERYLSSCPNGEETF